MLNPQSLIKSDPVPFPSAGGPFSSADSRLAQTSPKNGRDESVSEEGIWGKGEGQYWYLFQNNPQAMWVYDLEHLSFLEVNEAAIHNYGYSRQEFLTMTIKDIRPPEDVPALMDDVARTTATINKAGIWRHRTKDGTLIDVEIVSHALTFAGRDARLVLITNVTENRRAEQKVRETADQLKIIWDSVQSGIVLIDAETHRIVDLNAVAAELFGNSKDQIIGAVCHRFICPAELGKCPVTDLGQKVDNAERAMLRADGGRSPIIKTVTLVTIGGRKHLLESFIDITERKRAETALQRFKLGIERSDEAIFMTELDGTISYVNPAFEKVYGYTRAEALGQTPRIIKSGRLSQDMYEHFWSTLTHKGIISGEIVNKTKDGRILTMEGSANPILDEKGEIIAYLGIQRDITERKKAEQALRDSEERYALAAQGANDGLWDWDLKTDRVFFSTRWKAMLGYGDGEIQDRPDEWFRRVHPEDIKRLRADVDAHLSGGTQHLDGEYRLQHRDGTYLWMRCRGLAVRDQEGKAHRMAGSQTDISARKSMEDQLLHDAFYDSLTGLANRALFVDRLGRSIERAKRVSWYQFAVLFLDLDRFKLINDSLGHAVGDELLVACARRLEMCLRSMDTVARLGGDEFAILLEDSGGAEDAEAVADRIQGELALPFDLDGHRVFNSASIGIVLSDTGYERADDVLRDADTAMYRAKVHGKARYELFNPTMRERAVARLDLETDLRSAINLQELRLHYQPIVSLGSNRIIGFEALVRWEHPTHGLIPPANFIPVAEETGLILPIGKWVLKEACGQMREWQDRHPTDPPLTISVNLSAKQFTQPDLSEQIKETLEATGLAAKSLKLEITESVLIEEGEVGRRMLKQLRALGIQVEIDDFGTGYSSLSYLQQLPLDTLKIDRSFISHMGANGKGSEIVRTIMLLAQEMGMRVIAEGVETGEQLTNLKALGCEFAQGYLFSRPVEQSAAEALIAGMGRT